MEKDLQDFITQYPGFENCAVMTLDDNKNRCDKGLTRPFSEFNFDVLNDLNKKGAAVFFSVNPMKKGERSQKSVTKIVSWVCDIDNMSKEEQYMLVEQSPIKPSGIIESKNSLHLYWFASDGTVENFKKIGNGVMQFFKGDPAVCLDYGGLLRLPGFMHMKDPDDPFLVKLISIDANIKYTEKEMLDSFPVADAVVEVKQYEGSYVSQYDGIRGEISKWDNEQMLKELSGKNIVNWEAITFKKNPNGTKQIVVNGKPSGAWIDTKGMIGSHSKGGPTWVQFVLRYKTINRSQLLKYIKDNYSYKLSPEYVKKIEKETYLVKGKVIAVDFAMYLKESESFEGIDGNIFKYFSDEGLRKKLNENEVGQIIVRESKEFLEINISKSDLESVLRFLEIHAESRLMSEQIQKVNEREICLYDGILSVDTRTVRPYTKTDYKFSKLPYNSIDIKDYEKHLPHRFLQFMSEIFASYKDIDGVISYRQEAIGYFLLPTTKIGKIHILRGGGRNGKGKFIEAIENMIGENNCCTINLAKLEDVNLEKMLGKLLAVDSDTSDDIRLDLGTIRKITAGESIEGRKRYGHPFEFKPFARIILSANIDPTIKFMDKNMIRRVVYVPFRETFQNRADPELGDKLKNEALGLFIRSLRGTKRLIERGYFIVPDEIQQETEKYLSKFKSVEKVDIIDDFIEYMGLIPGDDLLSKNDIFGYYMRYYQLQGKKCPLGKQQLTRVLWNKGFSDKDDSSRRGMGVNLSLLDLTFGDKRILEKSYEDSG